MNTIEFNEDERDCLQELMNISYGGATASISKILNSFATLQIPQLQIIPSTSLYEYLDSKISSNQDQLVASQILNGELGGENLFIIDYQSAKNLALEFDLDYDDMTEDDLFDIVLETANIMSSSTIGRLAGELESHVLFAPPSIQKVSQISKLGNRYILEYQQVIVISTKLEFEEQSISAQLLFLTNDESILWLKERINKILEEY
ncbi:MAG: chemotaxis protein CheC [Campylobacterales bacterium]|nr:chemotaxis protein CheC [Campylobacterales bacterium]